jgi:tRNA pseudouridine32 synthase / 23S rRNA pseudouridine746 synthase
MNILFENEQFIVVDKPGGWLSVPSQWADEDPRTCLSIELSKKLNQQIWPVHRLDLEVTGIVLFAKNANAHRFANGWFENRSIDKTYEALTEGPKPETNFYEWSSLLQAGKKRTFASPKGRLSVTRAFWKSTVELPDGPAQHWILDPLTGRRHQLRVHLVTNGQVILGDKLYGAKREFLPNTIALRAVKLDFSNCDEAARLGLPKEIKGPSLAELKAQK